MLYLAILTGAALGIVEVYPNWRGVFEVRSLVIAAKLLLLCLIPLLWELSRSYPDRGTGDGFGRFAHAPPVPSLLSSGTSQT